MVTEELTQASAGAHSHHPAEAWHGGHKHCISREDRGSETLSDLPGSHLSQTRMPLQVGVSPKVQSSPFRQAQEGSFHQPDHPVSQLLGSS